MAANPTTNPTMADWIKRTDPDGSVSAVAELLNRTDEIVDDAVMLEANGPTSHQFTVRTGLPTVYWRAYNQGIVPSKSTTAQITESMAILESRSEIDQKIYRMNGESDAWRMSEEAAFIESMGQERASTLWYGNPASNAKQFLGLSARYSSTTAGNGQNVISGGGTTADVQTSIWLVGWGEGKVYLPFPKGSPGGLEHDYRGEQTVYNVNNVAGTRMEAQVSVFCLQHGLAVQDWRNVVRIPNVEVSHFSALTSTQSPTTFGNVLHKMAQAVYRIPSLSACKPAFYMNRTVHSGLSRLAAEKTIAHLTFEEGLSEFGTPRKYLSFMKIPIRLSDSLINTEAVVS